MTNDASRSPGVVLRIVYEDLPDLVQIEAQVVRGVWSGVAQAYTSPSSLAEEARGLLAWSRLPIGEYSVEAGADTGIGWVRLRWYAVDLAGHIACLAQLASPAIEDRPKSTRRLTLEFPVEPYALEQFARQLVSLANSLTGEAVLRAAT